MSEPNNDKTPLDSPEVLENKPEGTRTPLWTGGHYSCKAFRSQFIAIGIVAVLCIIGAIKITLIPKCAIGSWTCWLAVPVIWGIYTLIRSWYCSYTIKYILEEDRLICKKGLFSQTTDTILIPQMNDLQLHQTLVDRIINGGVGTVIMYTTDQTDPVLKIEKIENPQQAFNSIDTLRKEYVRRRGIKSFGAIMNDDDGSGAGTDF